MLAANVLMLKVVGTSETSENFYQSMQWQYLRRLPSSGIFIVHIEFSIVNRTVQSPAQLTAEARPPYVRVNQLELENKHLPLPFTEI
jgi:hypothetical protein